MCTHFCDIWRKYVGKGAKRVFWRNFKMAENLSWRKWAGPIWGDASWPKESREKIIVIFRPTVQELRGKWAVIAPPWGRVEMLLGIRWVCHPRPVVKIQCWLDDLFVIYGYCLRNGPLSLTLEACYERTVWTVEISLDYVHCMGS